MEGMKQSEIARRRAMISTDGGPVDEAIFQKTLEFQTHLHADSTTDRLRMLSAQQLAYSDRIAEKLSPSDEAPEYVMIDDAYSTSFKDRHLSASQRRKRKSAYSRKFEIIDGVRQANKQIVKDREESLMRVGYRRHATDMEGTTRTYHLEVQQDRHSDAFRDLIAYYESRGETEKSDSVYERLLRNGVLRRNYIYDSVLQEIQNDVDLKVFAYKDDKDFVQKYAAHYAKLKAYSHGLEFLEAKKTESLDTPQGVDLLAVRAKCEMINDILRDYEARMSVIQSPYYALFAGKDFEKMTDDEIQRLEDEAQEPALKEYFAAVRGMKGKQSYKQGKGFDMDKLSREKREEVDEKNATAGKSRLQELSDGFAPLVSEIGSSLDTQEGFNATYDRYVEKQVKDHFPDLDIRALQSDLPFVLTGIETLFEDDLREFNQQSLDMLDNPEKYGLSTEDRNTLQGMLERVAKAQTAVDRLGYQITFTNEQRLFFDPRNPKYTNEELVQVAKLAQAVSHGEAVIRDTSRAVNEEYAAVQKEVLAFRFAHGFVASEDKKHWKKVQEAMDKGAEPVGMATLNGEEIPVFYFSFLEKLKGKELIPKDCTPEELHESATRMVAALKRFLPYYKYMGETQGLVTGVESWELNQLGDSMREEAMHAVDDFKSKIANQLPGARA